jgi:hypothetical protein
MIAIGFAKQFYTLWDYSKEEQYFTDCNGKHHFGGYKHRYVYLKNISKDIDKVNALYPNLEPNLELYGRNSSWERADEIKFSKTQFSYGRYKGTEILECNDVWQLTRCYNDQFAGARRAFARRRLIELGELVRYDWLETIGYNPNWHLSEEPRNLIHCVAVRKYATCAEVKLLEAKKAEELRKSQTTFLHQNGDKVELELTQIDQFSFETQFGYCSIVTYQNREGQVYKYKGGTPPNLNDSEYHKVKCTIKHAEYNGEKQTLIQRVKLLTT